MRYHMPLVNISLPRKLPDLDGDRISELVAACAVTFPSEMTDNRVHVRTNFILISGHHGKVMGRPYEVDTCTDIGAINVTSTLALQFDCTSQHGGKSLETTPIGRKFLFDWRQLIYWQKCFHFEEIVIVWELLTIIHSVWGNPMWHFSRKLYSLFGRKKRTTNAFVRIPREFKWRCLKTFDVAGLHFFILSVVLQIVELQST